MTSAYEKKRDFAKTPEPKGDTSKARRKSKPKQGGGQPIFVFQKHDASTLHYDFRLEVDGVLKSWAVPKGPSTDPREKRLALPTEDHPIDYAEFEGVIPQDEYGGGTVQVWDKGIYRNITEKDGEIRPMAEALDKGHALVWLEGKKLIGGYALQRTGKGDDARWLLVKMRDEESDARRNPTSTQSKSVISGRTMDEIAEEEEPESP
jgi:DNA ligase D-like protein (predicted 3'-phosphoesterase)